MVKLALTPEQKARNRRSIAIAVGLFAFVILVFVVTVLRMKGVPPAPHF
jgi:uncharacterized protein involved in exopolysaccharide biosynthesis